MFFNDIGFFRQNSALETQFLVHLHGNLVRKVAKEEMYYIEVLENIKPSGTLVSITI